MTNGNQLTREEQAMLVEYQVCQQEKQHQSVAYWTLFGIFLSVNTAVAGYLIAGILKREFVHESTESIILVFSIIALAIILFLGLWLKRTNKILHVANDRMREIEDTLENIIQLNHQIKRKLDESKCLSGKCIAIILFLLISIPWLFLIVATICSLIGNYFFN